MTNLDNDIQIVGTPPNQKSLYDVWSAITQLAGAGVQVYNPSGSTITAGALVYFNGYNAANNVPTIALADATDPTKTAQAVVPVNILTHAVGAVNNGLLVSAYDTSARSVGDLVYSSVTTPGSVQFTAPTAAAQVSQVIGTVAVVGNPGTIFYVLNSPQTFGTAAIQPLAVTNAKVAAATLTGDRMAAGVKGNIIGPVQINYSGLTATKDVITGIPLGFIGSIVKIYGIVTIAGSGVDSGAGTLDFILSASGQIQSAGPATVTLPIAKTDTLYQVTAASATPTLQNTFVAADTIKIHYTQSATFGTDTGVIWVYFVTN